MPRHKLPFGKCPSLISTCLLFCLGIANLALPLALVQIAIRCVSIGAIGILQTTRPMFAILFSLLFVSDARPMHWLRPVGMIISFFGVIFSSLHLIDTTNDECSESESLGYLLLVVLSAALEGVCSVLAERYMTHLSDLTLASGQTIFGSIFITILSISIDLNEPNGYEAYVEELTGGDLILFLCLTCVTALFSCIGWSIFFYLNRVIGAIKVLTYSFLELLVYIFIGIMLLRHWEGVFPLERVITIFGMIVTVVGSYLCLQHEGEKFAYTKAPLTGEPRWRVSSKNE
eukprot:c15575_g1_i2.p1 GENE.c15575_g1_i2~~c15575_g1_i2.p1  ORF type:complete len:288 (-),score=84.33 c15575_g1_i2:3-866(-)